MKFKNFTILTVSLLSAIYSDIALSECIEGKIKHIFQNKEVITNENYCYELDSVMLMSSDSCADGKVCQNRELEEIKVKMDDSSGETGSLGFKICEKYKGTPQIMEFWAANEWHSSSRCIFDDKSFIDNSTLAQKVKYLE